MEEIEIHIAYIDGANIHRAATDLGWKLDYVKFRIWLAEKYKITRAYWFVGFIAHNTVMYTNLKNAGFELIFKEVSRDSHGKVKGNCDAEFILKATVDYFEKKYTKALIVTSDGDFACLVLFLKNKDALAAVISPRNSCSFLIMKLSVPIVYLDTQREFLEYIQIHDGTSTNEKALDGDGTPQRSLSSE